MFFCCQSKPALNPRFFSLFFFVFFFVLFFHFFFFIISKKILLHTHTHPDFPHYLLVVVFWLLIDFFHSFSLPNKTQFVLCVLHRVPSDHFLLGFCFPCASIIELVFFFSVSHVNFISIRHFSFVARPPHTWCLLCVSACCCFPPPMGPSILHPTHPFPRVVRECLLRWTSDCRRRRVTGANRRGESRRDRQGEGRQRRSTQGKQREFESSTGRTWRSRKRKWTTRLVSH